jgi:hypothetical protein
MQRDASVPSVVVMVVEAAIILALLAADRIRIQPRVSAVTVPESAVPESAA